MEQISNRPNSQPKPQPKSAVPTKTTGASTRGKGRAGRKPRNPRPAKKTAEELDSEMADYWETGAATGAETAATGAAQPATNGDATMDEEILVRPIFANNLGSLLTTM